MCAMFCPASATIAIENPELSQQIQMLDSFFAENPDGFFSAGPTADRLHINMRVLERVFEIYERHGAVQKSTTFLCPAHNSSLSENADGELFCDLCDMQYQSEQCSQQTVYHLVKADGMNRHQVLPQSVNEHTSGKMSSFKGGYALVIGIADYLDPEIAPTLPDAVVNDARAMAALLTNPAYCGYRTDQVRLLLDKDASLEAIRDGLNWLSQVTKSKDTAVVFFSGHGGRNNGQAYLLPYDCTGPDTAISSDELTSLLKQIKAERLVVLLDSCHSGGAGELKRWKDSHQTLKLGWDEQAYDKLSHGKGRVIIAASRADEPSRVLDNMPNSVFTFYLLEALKGGQPTIQRDGLIHILDVFRYVSEMVPSQTEQHPILKTHIENDFPIALYLGGAKGAGATPRKDGTVNKQRLREVLIASFSLDELELLCADMQQDIGMPLSLEIVGGTGKEIIAQRLIDLLDRHGLLDHLVRAVRTKRPRSV